MFNLSRPAGLLLFMCLLFATDSAQAQLSRNAMIGQMLMMGFPGSSAQSAWPRRLAAQIRRGEVGGVVMLGYNFKSRQSVTGLTSLFRQAAGRRKLFLALDMEGGASSGRLPQSLFGAGPNSKSSVPPSTNSRW